MEKAVTRQSYSLAMIVEAKVADENKGQRGWRVIKERKDRLSRILADIQMTARLDMT